MSDGEVRTLSETSLGRSWLENFEPPDRTTATVLLDSLRVYSDGEFYSGLLELLRKVIVESTQPICLYPVRAPRFISMATDPAEGEYAGTYDEVVAEPDIERPLSSDDGSELLIARVLRDLSAEMRSVGYDVENYNSLDQLRARKVRRILLVDDYSGSGDKAMRCFYAWLANPTLRSWKSFGWVGLTYVGYSVSADALVSLGRYQSLLKGKIEFAELAPSFDSADWSQLQRDEIVNLCKRYSSKGGRALGWKNSAGLAILPHTTPNNLPRVFTQQKGRGGRPWKPLVSRATATDRGYELEGLSFQPSLSLAHAALRAGQRKLAIEIDKLDNRLYQLLVIVLGISARRRLEQHVVAQMLSVSDRVALDLIGLALRLRLVENETLRISELGRDELERARSGIRRTRHARVRLHDNDAPYYPVSLRRGRGI